MKRLYIIGNGFDLYHHLETWYYKFGLYVQEKDSQMYEHLMKYFNLDELDEDDEESLKSQLWAQFEEALASFSIDNVLEDLSEYAPNVASDEFRDRDWHEMEFYAEQILKIITINLLELFKTFLRTIVYPPNPNLLSLDRNSLFFNFNYTDSLEHYYKIPAEQILYIHNKATGPAPLILGHGLDPTTLSFEEKPPEGLDEEQLMEWEESQSDYSVEQSKQRLIAYFKNSFKNTATIIANHQSFFAKLASIEEVYILGHSLADVDKAYFEKIIKSIANTKTKWFVTYHNPADISSREQKLIQLGLEQKQITLIRMQDLL